MGETALSLIKGFIVGVISSIASYFLPIGQFVIVIIAAFILNFFTGLVCGYLVSQESFNFKKAKWALIEMAIYLVIVASGFFIGEKMKDTEAFLKGIYGVTYAFIYFYTVNILKNLKQLLPRSQSIRFLYFILSIEFIKKIPFMTDFLKYESKKADGQTNN